MSIGQLCNREVIVVHRDEPIREAIRLMRKNHVGDVVVVDERDGHRQPVGVLTDRDIVVELLAANIDLDRVAIGDAMSFELVTAREDEDLFDTIERMQKHGVRRMPVVGDTGAIVGIITLDDIIELASEQLSGLARLVRNERAQEQERRP